MKKNKIVTSAEAVAEIKDGDTLAVEGFLGSGTAEELCLALEKRYQETNSPKNLTMIHSSGPGDTANRGINHLAHSGLFKRVISGHFGLVPKIGQMALQNEFESYNFPQGILTNFFRAVAGNRPGFFSRVGLGTFVDPRIEGGKVNEKAMEDLLRVIEIDGEEWLFMKSSPVDVCFIRGTTADIEGNVTMEREVLFVDALSIAMATHNGVGKVIVQVERIADRGDLRPKEVKVPGILVDYVVVAPQENHMQTLATQYNPSFSGELRVPMKSGEKLALDERKIIARRANLELSPYDVINLGIGVPEGVSVVAREEKILDYLTMTVEPGIIGGMPTGGLDFGASVNPEAVIDMPDQFDFYDGGGLDLACLGMAQCDEEGNVNSSKFGLRLAGCGGFIDISQNAQKTLFVGTFTAGGLEIAIDNKGFLKIIREGKTRKFVKHVDQITFSGKIGSTSGQEIFYITERCVFKLINGNVELIEVAHGIDIEKDILAHMDFIPSMNNVGIMDHRIFKSTAMGIRREFLKHDIDRRSRKFSDHGILFYNFKGLEAESLEDVDIIKEVLERRLTEVDGKIKLVATYALETDEDLMEHFMEMGRSIEKNFNAAFSPFINREELIDKLGEAFVILALQS
ncbi:MAG: acyl CoA:acetate/3-ketoacid CoA transferase [Syntrophales bacterium]|nr:acyl CoA:acetate/3-ketoacid CoA transferase [Syntrophales bacterium]